MSTDPDPKNTLLGFDQNFVYDTLYSNNKLKIMYIWESTAFWHRTHRLKRLCLVSNNDVTAFTGETGEHDQFEHF